MTNLGLSRSRTPRTSLQTKSARCWQHTLALSRQGIETLPTGVSPHEESLRLTAGALWPWVQCPWTHHECIVCMTMRVRSMGPSMLDRAVVSASGCIRPNRAIRTHRNRVPHAPDTCLFRQAHHDPILRDRATKFTPAELVQEEFSKKEIVGVPSCPLVDMPLANSSWVLPRGDGDWLAKGFGIELYTLTLGLDGSGVPGPTFSFKTLGEVPTGLARCDLPMNSAAAGHRIARYAPPARPRGGSPVLGRAEPPGPVRRRVLSLGSIAMLGHRASVTGQRSLVALHPRQTRGSLLPRGLSPFSPS